MNIKNILFDLDGTIIESSPGVVNSVTYAFEKLNTPVPSRADLLKFIGPPLIDSFKLYFDDEKANQAISFYREYYTDKGITQHSLYENIDTLLKELKGQGYNLFVATSKPTVFAKQILKDDELDHLFTEIVGSNLDNTRKDKVDIISYVLEHNELEPSASIMIGDRHYDINGAKKTNLKSIGVVYGHGSRQEFEDANADYIVDTVEELGELLKEIL